MQTILLKEFKGNLYTSHRVYLYKNKDNKNKIMIESFDQDLETKINYPVFYTFDSWGLDYPDVFLSNENVKDEIKEYCFELNDFLTMN
jgi:hypothetical protein